jgi:hypothetical protein
VADPALPLGVASRFRSLKGQIRTSSVKLIALTDFAVRFSQSQVIAEANACLRSAGA